MNHCLICEREIMPDLFYYRFLGGDGICQECAAEKDTLVNWTPEKLEKFKKVYEGAEERIFIFERHVFDTGYAKYLIQYLEGKFK